MEKIIHEQLWHAGYVHLLGCYERLGAAVPQAKAPILHFLFNSGVSLVTLSWQERGRGAFTLSGLGPEGGWVVEADWSLHDPRDVCVRCTAEKEMAWALGRLYRP